MEIKIALDKIQNGIMQLTALIARNRQDMSLAVTQDTLPAIGIYIGEAVTEVENELRRHIKESNTMSLYRNDEAVILNIQDKIRTPDGIVNQTGSSFELYLIHYSIARWMNTIPSVTDLAEAYSNSAGGYISKLSALVCQRETYKVDKDSYKNRDNDTISIRTQAYEKEEYYKRVRDLHPTGRTEGEWPDDKISTTDPAIPIDSNGHILIAKPNNRIK